MNELLIAPSILSADFSQLGQVLQRLDGCGSDWVHLDVMDGRFVPNLTFGPPVIKHMRSHSRQFFDAHLMMVEPERYVDAFAQAGCDAITVHAEASPHLHRTLSHIRSLGKLAGVAFNPSTSIEVLPYVLDCVDLVLIMSVNPGFGGQKFIPSVLPKIKAVRALVKEMNARVRISVDGGIDTSTAPLVVEAGADVLVAGTAIFGGTGNLGENVANLRFAALNGDSKNQTSA